MMAKKETIIRTIVLFVALANQVLVGTGHTPLPVEEETIVSYLSLTLTVGASLWAWWKNNSFTKKAIEADEILHKKEV